MSKISDIINEAEGALSVKNEALAIRILIEALRAIDGSRRRITPEETGRVWEMWREGVSVETIAETLATRRARQARHAAVETGMGAEMKTEKYFEQWRVKALPDSAAIYRIFEAVIKT